MDVLAGDLTEFPLPDVLRLLAATSKSGHVEVQLPAGVGERQGRIELVEGRVRAATTDVRTLGLARRLVGAGLLEPDALEEALADRVDLPGDAELAATLVATDHLGVGEAASALRCHTVDAVVELSRAGGGNFRFQGLETPGEEPGAVPLGIGDLLAEVEAGLAELAQLGSWAEDHAAVPVLTTPQEDTTIDPQAVELLALIDGRRTIAELASLRGSGVLDTLRRLQRLRSAQLVAIGEADPAPADRLLAAERHLATLEARFGGATDTSMPLPSPGSAPASGQTSAPAFPLPSPPADDDAAEVTPPPTLAAAPARPGPGTAPPAPLADAGRRPVSTAGAATSALLADRQHRAVSGRTGLKDRLASDVGLDEDTLRRLLVGIEALP